MPFLVVGFNKKTRQYQQVRSRFAELGNGIRNHLQLWRDRGIMDHGTTR